MPNRNNRCSCGICPACARSIAFSAMRSGRSVCRCGFANCDCARWERIYREKFEDPDYYDLVDQLKYPRTSNITEQYRFLPPHSGPSETL